MATRWQASKNCILVHWETQNYGHCIRKRHHCLGNEQASFIRAGRFDLLDIEHLAEEIEDVGKSEQRELENRMAVLLAHLLKWQFQPTHRGASWQKRLKFNGLK